jgi:hypothetical protein
MGYRFVTTAGSVNVFGIVTATVVCRSTTVGIGRGYLEQMLFDLPVFSDVVQVTVVQVIYVTTMLNASVFAIGSMLVIVMSVRIRHRLGSSHGESGTVCSIACMTPLVTNREM